MEHERIDAATLSARETYQLMTDLVAPRPIAWVSTQDAQGRRNLAPFSYYQAVCSHPPTVILGLAWRPDGTPKDTLRNILETREFVVNHTSHTHTAAMNLTSGEYEPAIDEWSKVAASALAELTPISSVNVAPPRIAEVAAAMECRLTHAIPLGTGVMGRPSSTLVVGEVLTFWVGVGLRQTDVRGRTAPIDPRSLDAVGRLGGIAYTDTRGSFTMARPKTGPDA